MSTCVLRATGVTAMLLWLAAPVAAQAPGDGQPRAADPPPEIIQPPAHQPMQMSAGSAGWQFMQDGVLFAMFDHQGSPRGGDEFKAPNWWMGMAARDVRSSRVTFTGMVSLDPATTGKRGYAEIFQVGEAVGGRPLVDRQHPHDFFMQLAAIWRVPVGSATGITLAGGPVGEPALGPVAFMHRASAAEVPMAPLGHHTFDSTHVAFGVVTAAVDHGPWIVEASVFNGREPDENRWNFDFGPLDSVSARVWYRPTPRWEFQVSTGHLVHPEQLEPGNIQRTTASAAWFAGRGTDFQAVTAGYGMNATADGTRQAAFGEATRHVGRTSVFGRVEVLQVETALLLGDAVPAGSAASARSTVAALTVGGARDIIRVGGFEGGLGAAVTLFAAPGALAGAYGRHPASFVLFLRLRPPAGGMGRMWNMRMSQPMLGHAMDHQMAP